MEAVRIDFLGSDPKIIKAVQFAQNIASTKAPLLIVGEAGTGKRSLANYVHHHSSRTSMPLEVVDCSEDPKIVENNILGFRNEMDGKFIKGALEQANKGTVVLTNIDGLDEEFQKKLHKILLELEDYEIDVRVICTTTKNLSKLVGAGRFYRGLYNFVSGTQVNLPPLRERTHDIKNLALAMLKDFAGEQGVVQITPQAIEKLTDHYWTHNISELKLVIENSFKTCDGEILDVSDLAIGDRKTVVQNYDHSDDGIQLMSLKEAEKLLIRKALIHTSENRTQAAKILGVSIRTLRNKINEYRNDGNQFFINLR